MREYYVLKYQSQYHDTPTEMDILSGENTDEYFKAMDDGIQSLMRRDTRKISIRKSIDDQNVLPATSYSSERGNLIGQSVNSRHDIV